MHERFVHSGSRPIVRRPLLGLLLLLAAQTSAAMDVLSLGVFPRRNPQVTTRMFMPLADHLSRELGREVRLEVTRDFESFWEAVAAGRYDLVHYNPYHYIRSAKEQGYRVIAKNDEFGRATVASALVVRKDSGIESLEQLRGRKIVFGGGPTAMLSYVMNTHLLRQAGLGPDDYVEEYAISPLNAVFATYYGHAAAGGAGNIVLGLPNVQARVDTGELRYLAQSEELAHLPWAVKGDMAVALRERIQAVLTGLKDSAAGRAVLKSAGLTGLHPAQDAEYEPHRHITWAVLQEDYCAKGCKAQFVTNAANAVDGPLYMSVFPRRERRKTFAMFDPIAQFLSQSLGRPVHLETHKTFDEFWRGIKERRYDLIHANQFQYVRAHKLYGYDVILKNEEFGDTTITPAIYVRKDSGIADLRDLKGRRVIFGGGKLAMISYVGNLQLLRRAGLRDDDYDWSFAVTPPNGCHAMFLGQADACGAATVLVQLPVFHKMVDISQLRVLATNVPLAHVNWAVKATMDETERKQIQSLLAGLHETEQGRAVLKGAGLTALRQAHDGDYDLHRAIIRDVLGEQY